MAAAETRQQIVDEADRLFYERGFAATSLADLAAAVRISRGNFYYHFRTKDEILDAVIIRRLENTAIMLGRWQADGGDPIGRIFSFIDILVMNRAKIMAHGCPVGTLCGELAKLDHAAQADAAQLFTLFRDWLAGQFASLGRTAEADALALHLLGRTQGVATLATAFRDEAYINSEIADMRAWVRAQIV